MSPKVARDFSGWREDYLKALTSLVYLIFMFESLKKEGLAFDALVARF